MVSAVATPYTDRVNLIASTLTSASRRRLSAAELRAFDRIPAPDEFFSSRRSEPAWIVRPSLAAGSITAFSGEPKTAGKSTFLWHMVKTITAGTPFLGEMPFAQAGATV
jgi:hypothetical protein